MDGHQRWDLQQGIFVRILFPLPREFYVLSCNALEMGQDEMGIVSWNCEFLPWNCGVVLGMMVGGPKIPFWCWLRRNKIQFPWLFLSMLHHFSRIFPEHPKCSLSSRNFCGALLEEVVRVFLTLCTSEEENSTKTGMLSLFIYPLPPRIPSVLS